MTPCSVLSVHPIPGDNLKANNAMAISQSSITTTLQSQWQRIAAIALLAAALVGGWLWLQNEEAPSKPSIPPTVNDNVLTFSGRLEGIRTEAVNAADRIDSSFPARVSWAEEKTSRVRSPFSGRIVRSLVKVGDTVQAGQPLAEIHSSEYTKAEADFDVADAGLQRARILFDAGILSKRELQVAEADRKRAFAEVMRSQPVAPEAFTASANGLFTLRAPIAGVVVEQNLNPGQEYRPDQDTPPLFVISDPSTLWVWVDLSELDITELKTSRASLAITAHSGAFPSETFKGSIVQFSDYVDASTRTFRLRGVIDNRKRLLKSEMFVNVNLVDGSAGVQESSRFVVPTTAVFLVGEQRYVFVQVGDSSFARQEVRVTREIAGRSIVAGLSQGQRVVTDGNLYLQQIMLRSAKPGAAAPAGKGEAS